MFLGGDQQFSLIVYPIGLLHMKSGLHIGSDPVCIVDMKAKLCFRVQLVNILATCFRVHCQMKKKWKEVEFCIDSGEGSVPGPDDLE